MADVEGLSTAPSPPEGAALLPLRNRKREIVAYAILDAEDEARVAAHRWYLKVGGYVVRNIPHPAGAGQTQISLHRAVMGLKYGDPQKVDHRNHNPLDNRKSNLRVCTHAENLQNRATANRGSRSRHRGVAYRKDRGDWQAYARVGGKQHHLGFYADEEEAARVAADFRRERMPFATN